MIDKEKITDLPTVSCVPLQDVRDHFIQIANPSDYSRNTPYGGKGVELTTTGFKKKCEENTTNVTTFLAKDRDIGPARANRPDILFKIQPDNENSTRPNGYLMHAGRICLDPFDHGIRNFPELPALLSSELEGHDVEYYQRQNREITLYDMIGTLARPNECTIADVHKS